ncbi:hypothetical protein HKD37_15G043189 [Glycine soja]
MRVNIGVEEVRDANAPIPVPTQKAMGPTKHADRSDHDVDDPLYLMTLTIPQLFLKSLQVMWDATMFGGMLMYMDSSSHSQYRDLGNHNLNQKNLKRDVYLGAYLNGAHWQMVVILPKENVVIWFCSLHNRPDNYLKGIINNALKGFDDTPQSKSKVAAKWIVVKCNRQKGSIECGYYVMHWMSTIILGSFKNNWETYFNDVRPLQPERLKALRI